MNSLLITKQLAFLSLITKNPTILLTEFELDVYRSAQCQVDNF